MKREGQTDERLGQIKAKAERAIDAVRDKVEDVVGTITPGEKA